MERGLKTLHRILRAIPEQALPSLNARIFQLRMVRPIVARRRENQEAHFSRAKNRAREMGRPSNPLIELNYFTEASACETSLMSGTTGMS